MDGIGKGTKQDWAADEMQMNTDTVWLERERKLSQWAKVRAEWVIPVHELYPVTICIDSCWALFRKV